jgi:hypothetical protein
MGFLIDVMRSDSSITAVDYARKFFWKAAHLNESELGYNPLILELEPAFEWWRTNKADMADK